MPDEIRTPIRLSVQNPDVSAPAEAGEPNVFHWLVKAGELVPPWWSRSRDLELRRFALSCDHLASTVYTMVAKLCAIPFKVVPMDPTIMKHREQAKERTENLYIASDFYKGWNHAFGRFIYDYLTQDNGGFLEIIGAGDPSGPIIGWPVGVAHLDSSRCIRTSNVEYPVVYMDKNGVRYKLHYTRVIETASLPSTDIRMNGVGFSATSRSINVAQNLLDILVYKQEKLGSRPPRCVLVGSFVSADDIADAFRGANITMDQRNLTRFAQMVFIGNPGQKVELDRIDLASIPDGFDEAQSVRLGMAAIALAFGVDLREIWPAAEAGATKADAQLQHLKSRRKGWGEIMELVQRLFNQKYLPGHLHMKFDFQDDEEDALNADIENVRSQGFERYVKNKILTERVAREMMLERGDISDVYFEELELDSGRLEDGTNVLALFASKDPDMKPLVKLPVSNILDIEGNDAAAVIKAIDTQMLTVSELALSATPWESMKKRTRQALAALRFLRKVYTGEMNPDGSPNQAYQVGIETEAAIEQSEAEAAMAPAPDGKTESPRKAGDHPVRGNRNVRNASKREKLGGS